MITAKRLKQLRLLAQELSADGDAESSGAICELLEEVQRLRAVVEGYAHHESINPAACIPAREALGLPAQWDINRGWHD